MAFFRILDPGLPEFVRGHFRDHLRCLEQFFDVTVISENADYDQVVDRVQPELALFESGVYARPGRKIANTHCHPDVIKVGFLDADGYCATRSVFLSDMDDWGIDTFFGIAVSAGGYTPEIADRLFVWPNFADRALFRSYPGGASEPILLSGSRETNYPWRVKVDRLLRANFPVRTVAHAGWFDHSAAAAMPVGEAYARGLSAAQIVPTCGTIAEDLARKHFEIPASGALLLTERTAAVEAAGFADMVTCVFADERDVVDKVAHLFAHPDELERITRAGQQLAHSRHSIEHRDQLRQWFDLEKARAADERIVQPDPFGPLRRERVGGEPGPVGFVAPPGVDRARIHAGRTLLEQGRPAAAAEEFAQVLNFHFEPEAGLGLARSRLRLGQPRRARAVLERSVALVLHGHGASRPDPVEWALLIRALLCEGADGRAAALAAAYPDLRHPELDRMVAVIDALLDRTTPRDERSPRLSVHPGSGAERWERWRTDLARDLTACGRDALAARVVGLDRPAAASWGPPVRGHRRRTDPRSVRERVAGRLSRLWRRLRRGDGAHERTSVFQLFGGREVDAVILVLVPDDVARRVAGMVARDPSSTTLVRVGGTPDQAPQEGATTGQRWGVDARRVGGWAAWGRSILITGPEGAELLTTTSLESVQVLVVLGPGRAPEPLRGAWSASEGDLIARVADAFSTPDVGVWERDAPVAVAATDRGVMA